MVVTAEMPQSAEASMRGRCDLDGTPDVSSQRDHPLNCGVLTSECGVGPHTP